MAVQQVRVRINEVWHTLTFNSLTGKYEKTITAPATTSFHLDGGYYPVTVEAADDSGNVTVDSSGRLIVKDTIAPTVTITSPTDNALLDINQPVVHFTLRDEANGSGVDLETLNLRIDGVAGVGGASPGMICTAAGGGYDCAYTPQSALTDGDHTIEITCADHDGNQAQAATSGITIDTTPPNLNLLSPTDGLKTNTDTVTVSGVTNDAVSKSVTVAISVNGNDQGTVTVAADGSFTKVVSVSLGENTIAVRATDGVGKFTEITRGVSINKSAPVISNVAASPNPVNAGESVLISVAVTDA